MILLPQPSEYMGLHLCITTLGMLLQILDSNKRVLFANYHINLTGVLEWTTGIWLVYLDKILRET
jgi:hypothetical protein